MARKPRLVKWPDSPKSRPGRKYPALREEIRRHDHLYYAESNPEIPTLIMTGS